MALATIGNSNHPADLVAFHHAALFSSTLDTLETAINNQYLPPLPGLTLHTLRRHRPSLEATAMGHMDARRKNIQSTKKKSRKAKQGDDVWTLVQSIKESQPDDTALEATCRYPLQDTARSHHCYLATAEPKSIVYTDQTRRFLVPSSTGNNNLLIAYNYNSNNILLCPIKDRSQQSLSTAIKDVHETLKRGGCQPKYHRKDNECPQLVKDYFNQEEINYQLAPPGEHRTNAAKRAIRTAKNHLKAGWWAMDKDFPMHLWDQTIPQAEISLNLLRGSRINPKLSAHEQLHGRFDFNATPLAPPGVKVLAHARAGERATWATNAFEAWYVGPALEHYRCFTVWATKTRKPRIVNQVLWFPPKAFPKLTSKDLLRATIEDLKVILLNPPTETYVGNLEQTQRGELLQLQEVLHQTAQPVQLKKTAPLLGVPAATQPKQSTATFTESAHAPLLGVPNTHTEDSTPQRSNQSSQQPIRYVPTMANQAIDQPN